MADQRDHDLGLRVPAGRLDRDERVEDRAGLDLHEVRDHQAEPAAAQPEHRVLLVQALDRGQELLVLLGGATGRLGPGDLDQLVLEVGQELVERRVDQPDDHRQPVHRAEDALEVALLEDLELGHRRVEGRDRLGLVGGQGGAGRPSRLGPGGGVGDEDRAAHDLEPLALAEHVLRPAQADALGAVAAGHGRLLGLVGVGPDLHAADLVGPAEDRLELGLVLEPGGDRRQRAEEDLAGRAVDADPVALGERGRRSPRPSRRRSRCGARDSRPRTACRSGGRPPRRGSWRRRARSGCPGRRPCRGSRRATSRSGRAPRARRWPPTRPRCPRRTPPCRRPRRATR